MTREWCVVGVLQQSFATGHTRFCIQILARVKTCLASPRLMVTMPMAVVPFLRVSSQPPHILVDAPSEHLDPLGSGYYGTSCAFSFMKALSWSPRFISLKEIVCLAIVLMPLGGEVCNDDEVLVSVWVHCLLCADSSLRENSGPPNAAF
jgi:hypothetical protein